MCPTSRSRTTRASSFRYDQRLRGAAGVAGDAAVLDLDLMAGRCGAATGNSRWRPTCLATPCVSTSTTTKPAALHDGDGYIDYGNGTASYYYSWTRMAVTGELDLGQGLEQVSGEAWMDHQWGDFETYQEGGWDWFSVQLEDGTDVMLYLIRDADGHPLRVDGSIVSPDGELSVLGEGDFVDISRRRVDESGRPARRTRRAGPSPFRTTSWR